MLKLLVAPVCLGLAYWNYFAPSPLCTVPGSFGFLSSMWVMYVIMAAAHSGPWFTAIAQAMSRPKG
ncbi:MAG: hypothetical protein NW215_09025 [Hyphomicrobiales bacterium]|nr:hypothetical protein [Hyphomicrobiales bacterium]